MANNTLSKKAQAMLDAHVAFHLEQLTGDHLATEIEEMLDFLLGWARKIKLADVVTPSMIKATVHKYAIDMEPGPGLPELVAQTARRLYQHPGHDQALIKDLLSDDAFQDLLDKSVDMEELRERIISETVNNPVYTDLISDVLYHGIRDFITQNPLTKKIPGAQSMMKLGKSVMDRATPNMEEVVIKYIRKNLNASLRQSEQFLNRMMTKEKLAAVVTDVWDKVKIEPVSRFRDYVSEEDVEDFFVIGYEYWRQFRKTEFFRSLADAGVDFFFDLYGKSSLQHLLDELGISRDMLLDDALHYGPHVVRALNKKGVLEPLIRRQLTPFYSSEAAGKLLD